MANKLMKAGMDITAAIGDGTAVEFNAFRHLYTQVPNIDAVLADPASAEAFPTEPSVRYATVIGVDRALQNRGPCIQRL